MFQYYLQKCIMAMLVLATFFFLGGQESGADVTAYTNQGTLPVVSLEKETNTKFISFHLFKKEFISTNSQDDYFRSLARLKASQRLNLTDDKITSIYKKIDTRKKLALKTLVSKLTGEAKAKSGFHDNSFYRKLTNLCKNLSGINETAFTELLLVDAQRKVGSKKVPLEHADSFGYFIYLIQLARYEVFLQGVNKH